MHSMKYCKYNVLFCAVVYSGNRGTFSGTRCAQSVASLYMQLTNLSNISWSCLIIWRCEVTVVYNFSNYFKEGKFFPVRDNIWVSSLAESSIYLTVVFLEVSHNIDTVLSIYSYQGLDFSLILL